MPANRRDLPDPTSRVVLDGRTLRALAHPLRIQILGALRRGGPSTATKLASHLGVNSGATSYHLRQLAEAGLVIEDAEHKGARDRWWRAAHAMTTSGDTNVYEADPDLATAYLQNVARVNVETIIRAIDAARALPKVWRDAGSMNDRNLRLTASELRQLSEDLDDVVERYAEVSNGPARRGIRPVGVQCYTFVRAEK